MCATRHGLPAAYELDWSDEDRVWRIRDAGEIAFSGSMQAVEDWLDRQENVVRGEAPVVSIRRHPRPSMGERISSWLSNQLPGHAGSAERSGGASH